MSCLPGPMERLSKRLGDAWGDTYTDWAKAKADVLQKARKQMCCVLATCGFRPSQLSERKQWFNLTNTNPVSPEYE